VDFGYLTVFHGGFDQTTDTSIRCADWFVANVILGAAAL
jgi:hypothetical protein